MLRVDPRKSERLDRALGEHFTLVAEETAGHQVPLGRREIEWLVAMGPSSWHVDPARLAELQTPLPVTLAVTVGRYRPLS